MYHFPLILFCFSISALKCEALPMLMLSSPSPKCVYVEVPEGTELQVKVESFDLADDSLKTRKKPNKLVVQQPEISEPQIQELNANVVFVVFKAYRNGEVEACIHAASASEKNVQRFSIDMQEMIRTSTGDEEQENMQLHISILETSVDHLRTQMTSILREADFAKEREAVFFEEVISMHEESRWWPIIHIVVLICAGFMQSQHIVTFFKNKHLI